MRTLVAVALVSTLAACGGREDGPSCDKVAARVASLVGSDDVDAMVGEIARTCRKAHWSGAMKRCVMGAQDEQHLRGCKPRRSGLVDGAVAFSAYEKKAQGTEAKLAMATVRKNLQALWAENAALPAGHVGPTPAIDACCRQDDRRCAPDPALWNDPLWAQLEFAIEDESHFSYEYESSDGRDAVFRALADLDCDGTPSVTEMHCATTDGQLACTVGDPSTD